MNFHDPIVGVHIYCAAFATVYANPYLETTSKYINLPIADESGCSE